jgi:pimeloyl-ACP methyl ester carboxylesterase
MKIVIKTILHALRGLAVLVIVLFALATLMGGSYLQTLLLILLAASLVWWPPFIQNRWSKGVGIITRVILIIVLLASSFLFFHPDPKTTIYLAREYEDELMSIYDDRMESWPSNTESIHLNTAYGDVHVLACGSVQNPPLVMVHAASMGAHSWAENLEPLLDHFRIYSVDNIGEGNRSQLKDALKYPGNQKEVADHFAQILDKLGIQSAPLFGASNGGFIIQSFAYYHPDRVKSMALFGPMGLTQLTGGSMMMLSIATLYPFQFIRNWVTTWALGENEYIRETYGEWFNCILKGTIPSVAQPVPMSEEQKRSMGMPVLLFLGTNDPIVGDPQIAREAGDIYPDIRIEILESGHLIAVEQSTYINEVTADFLGI